MAASAKIDRYEDEARLERAVARVLAPSTPMSQVERRPKAIFRVVSTGSKFEFTRTLLGGGVPGSGPTVDRFGPYETERAAHALAKRAAARLVAEHPRYVVGVVGLEEAVRSGSRASTTFRAEALDANQVASAPSCRTCGKATGFYHGRPQLYCPKSWDQIRSPCAEAAKAKRLRESPARMDAHRLRQRERYAQMAATPEGRARLQEKWRRKQHAPPSDKPKAYADPRFPGVVPTCEVCGQPTYFHGGRPVRFCGKKPGAKRSACQIVHQNRVFQQRLIDSPELREREKERSRQSSRKSDRRRRYTPEAWAKHLARNREYKARIRGNRAVASLPTGSVLATASPRTEGFDLLTRIYAAVPDRMPPSLRMEIISETAVLVLDGVEMSAAVTQATKSVRKNASRLRYAKPIEDCFWLADETQSISEDLL